MPFKRQLSLFALFTLPILVITWIWSSPLAFVPVPWPDDSAFYFVAKEFFKWPPRWVMLPQAPFEPTYRIFNFNTMPLYPMLIGLGRFIGIDGSHLLKLWPLGFFALSGSLLGVSLYRARLPALIALIFGLGFALDPELRWASVLVRPESLIGLCGMALVLGITLGFPRRLRAQGLWDPVAALLAVAAYAHFNAVHLLFIVVAAYLLRPRKLVETGLRSALYLVPWAMTVFIHPMLFIHQMTTQWKRLAVPNGWLSTPEVAIQSLFQQMGAPSHFDPVVEYAGAVLWVFIIAAVLYGLAYPSVRWFVKTLLREKPQKGLKIHHTLNLAPAAGWVLGSAWLWHNKPEVWFLYYIHAAAWTFAGLAALKAWQSIRSPRTADTRVGFASLSAVCAAIVAVTGIFGYVDVEQAKALEPGVSWHWSTYEKFIDCIDARLTRLETELNHPKPFRVWDPTFPDITVELSRRHPDWEFTRTNDFWERQNLAIEHGKEVEAMVVPESIGGTERDLAGPWNEHPEIRSIWMDWRGYYLNRFMLEPGFKPERYLCQRGKWQAFLFLKSAELEKGKP